MQPQKRVNNDLSTSGGGAPPRANRRLAFIARFIFWSWNGLLATIALFGLVPVLGVAFARDSLQGTVPPTLLLSLVSLIVLPVVSILVGLRVRREPARLLALFYGLEVPLLVLGIVRLFLVQELTTQLAVAAFVALLGLCSYAAAMLVPAERRRGGPTLTLFAGVAVLGVVAIAFALLGAAYAVPVLVGILRELPGAGAGLNPAIMIYIILGTAFGLYTATLTIASPIVAAAAYAFTLRSLARGIAPLRLAAAATLVATVAAVALHVTSQQPHTKAFALLDAQPHDDRACVELLAHSATIRAGLLDAYLAGYRYVTTAGDGSTLAQLYSDRFGGEHADYAWLGAFNDFMVAPFLFDAAPANATERAGADYAAFFDTTIEAAERARINEAMSASFQRSSVGASLLDRNAERVLVRTQDVVVTPHGEWADVEIHEEYVNVTPAMQELLYHFELPESSVITGLWLGESADKSAANVFQVAPRGAAQRVYQEAVHRSLDPALLEQVGPRQYRLRVFPILPESPAETPQPTHLWLRAAVMRDSGRYPLPRLTERRNAFFATTVRKLDGAPGAWTEWLPAAVDAPDAASAERVVNIDGFGVRLARRTDATPPVTGLSVAVVIDRSRSMQPHAAEVKRELAAVSALLGAGNTVEVVLASAPNRGTPVTTTTLAEVGDIVYYGAQSLSAMLRETVGNADLTLVLTDDDGVKHEAGGEPLRSSGSVWLVHLGGAFPAAYADAVGDIIARPGSGIAGSVADAVAKFSAARAGVSVDGEYVWSLVAAGRASTATGGFDALAARALVRLAGVAAVHRDVHRIAVDHAIVTPFSSMIVLVTDAQRAALERASASNDAFDRRTETGTVPHPPSFVTGVPEPEEWLLLGLGLALLLVARARSVAARSLLSARYRVPVR